MGSRGSDLRRSCQAVSRDMTELPREAFKGPGLRPDRRDVEILTRGLVFHGKKLLRLRETRVGVYEGVSESFLDRCPGYYSTLNHMLRVNVEYPFDDLDRVAVTVAHELIHARQHEDGRLYVKDGWIYWNEKRYVRTCHASKLPRSEYESLPWEVEALSREKGVAILIAHAFARDPIYRDDTTV